MQANFELQQGTVDVWQLKVDTVFAHLPALRHYLSQAECAKVDRLIQPIHQQRAQVAYAALRCILGRYLKLSPVEVEFVLGSHGKPYLNISDNDIYFNMTHSDSMLLIGVVRGCELGIDVEKVLENIEHMKLAERFFAAAEVNALKALPEQEQLLGFYGCWTRKEAFIKAIGLGLSFALKDFVVSLASPGWSGLLSVKNDIAAAKKWSLGSININGDYVAALAVAGEILNYRCYTIDVGLLV